MGDTDGDPRSGNGLHDRSRGDDDLPSCRMTVSGVTSSLDVVVKCDVGSDENVAKLVVAGKAVLQASVPLNGSPRLD